MKATLRVSNGTRSTRSSSVIVGLESIPLGEGAGLVQGLPRCAVHRMRKLNVHYKRGKDTGPRSHHYLCRGDWENCGEGCGRIPGGKFDDAVAGAVLRRLSPPNITAVREALEETLADSRAERRRREVERARLRHRVADLEAKLDAVGPDNQAAVRRLAMHLQEAENELKGLNEMTEEKRQRTLQEDVATLIEAEALASDVGRIWNAPTTQHRDRKELIRILVKTERVRIRIAWVDGAPDQLIDVWLPAGSYEKGEPAAAQLRKQGIAVDQITMIIISHSHWDHVSGLEDYPGVEVWLSQREIDYIHRLPTSALINRMIGTRALHPITFANRSYENFDQSVDLFDDGSVVLVPLPGHTDGSVGMFVNLRSGKRFFFIGDLTWAIEGIQLPAERPWLARRLVDEDEAQVRRTIIKVHQLAQAHPDLVIVPAHDRRMHERIATFPKVER